MHICCVISPCDIELCIILMNIIGEKTILLMGIYHICFFNWKSQNPLKLVFASFYLKSYLCCCILRHQRRCVMPYHNLCFLWYVFNFSFSWSIIAIKIELVGYIPPEVFFIKAAKILELKCFRMIYELSKHLL